MRIIDADKLKEWCNNHYDCEVYTIGYFAKIIDGIPTIEERKTGRWIHDGSHWANRWICDRCGYKLFGVKTKFCPDCGQRMEVEHETD